MTFISHAQNFEDVMLWRALKHIEQGVYIDIGAWSPDLDSVTRAFYERGWSGINVEPNPEFNDQLCTRRPRDVNLKVAVGEHEGVLTMNFLANPGLSTLDDAIAEKHQRAGWNANRREVPVTTLASIWHEYVPSGQEVHFLKVDVEGFEEAALRGNAWDKYRPWVVVVEATLPMSRVESHETWEPILLEVGYQLAYADGLNRFYVAQEHPELLPAFKYPPNVFDEFKLMAQQEAESRATQAESRATQAEARATQAEACFNDVINSTSWKITRPLRAARRAVQQLLER
jgi:FkbM family methyltransferase